MKFPKFMVAVASAVVLMSGCSTIKGVFAKRDNGSLTYRQSQKLAPIQLPANQPAGDFVPLYTAPNAVGELSDFTNEAGKQYQLPKPPTVRR
ncbi:hypothetical protein [Moraxella sp.]|uniref:hypothetical protein n=1 Tax=Moraxella sp. TaxID=479 RepID=UPI0026DD553A|nr:hypothetical protein [Moraxella sp.]MDO4895040.1 hypothetical protein [Moraxella sp.]